MINPALEQSELPPGAGQLVPDYELTREIGYYQLVWRRLLRHRLAVISGVVLLLLGVVCYLGPLLLPMRWDEPDLFNRYAAPSFTHLMGTDDLGRDLFKRILEGGQVSLAVGVLAMLVTIVLGGLIGALAGYFGRLADNAMMRFTDAILAIPQIFVLILIIASFRQAGHTPAVIIFAIGVTSWPYTARIIRSVVLSIREKEFVEAARATGSGSWKILAHHVLPNALGPIIVAATLTIGFAIILESALSFLGYGLGPPIASWGGMLFNANAFIYDAPYAPFAALFPGLMILIAVLCVNFVGDGLRDAFDPRSFER
jgi:peptide/nickel transport system permease protein